MYRPICCLLSVAIPLAALAADQPAEPLSVMLDQAIYTEQTAGDLPKAIKLYERIVRQSEANRALVAQAWFRLGQCHLKAGNDAKARQAFQAVIAEFSDQSEWVARARECLPPADIPEFHVCRIRETVRLTLPQQLETDWRRSAPTRTVTVSRYTLLEVAWETPDTLTSKVKSYAVQIGPEIERPGLPAGQTSFTWPSDPESFDADLTPGTYTVTVAAYDTAQAQLSDTGDDGHLLSTARFRLVVEPLPSTQIMINDLQPDGKIKFRYIGQVVHEYDQPLTSRRFMNSDFVEIERMHDAQGRPLKFTTEHRNNRYHYRVTLNEPVPPGKPLLSSNEGTISGLITPANEKNVYQYRMRHYPSSSRPTRRMELHRLPAGAELLSFQPADAITRTVDGRTELFLDEMIPAGNGLTVQYRYRLTDAQMAATKPTKLELQPVPWEEGEYLELGLVMGTGAQIGTISYSIERNPDQNWRMRTHTFIAAQNMTQFTEVVARPDDFTPISSQYRNNMYVPHARMEYQPGKVTMSREQQDGTAPSSVDVPTPIYDNEQAIHLIRRLPLTEGYRATFPLISPTIGKPFDLTVRVNGREKVTVPAGSFDCHRIELRINLTGVLDLDHTLWLSADEHRYLVQYDSQTALMKLTKIETRGDQSIRVTADKLDLAFTLPAGWRSFTYNDPGPYGWRTFIHSPEGRVWGNLLTGSAMSPGESLRARLEEEAQRVAEFFTDYTVRKDSWKSLKVHGLPAMTYVADYLENDRPKVEMRTYISGPTLMHWFVFRIDRDEFHAFKPTFERIVQSLEPGHDEAKTEADNLIGQGWAHWRKQEWTEAERDFAAAIELQGDRAEAWQGRGWAQFNAGKLGDARTSFKRCVELAPGNAAAWNGLGWLARREGNLDKAIQHWRKAVEAHPAATAALKGLAEALMAEENPKEAAKVYQQWLTVDPGNEQAERGLAEARRKAKD